jgi:8-oxo-dGTP diphosphatase
VNQKPFRLSPKIVILDSHGSILLLKRSPDSKHNSGTWEFPGGKLDPGETFDDALLREVAEETGLSVVLTRVLGAGELELPDCKVVYLFLEGSHVNGTVRLSEEHDAFVWIKPAELLQQNLSPQFRDIARNYSEKAGPRAERHTKSSEMAAGHK